MEAAISARLKKRQERLIQLSEQANNLLAPGTGIPLLDLTNIKVNLKTAISALERETHVYLEKCSGGSSIDTDQLMETQMAAEGILSQLEAFDTVVTVDSTSEQNNSAHSAKLPKLNLTTFDGDVLKFTEFWDQFEANVGCKNLKDVEKLAYLMKCLTGKALETLEGLGTTSLNYPVAREMLIKRFCTKQRVIDAHHLALINLPKTAAISGNCRKTLNLIEKHLRVLDTLGEDVNSNHFRVSIISKFPETVVYQVNLKTGGEATVSSLREALDHVITAMELSSASESDVLKASTDTAGTTSSLHITQRGQKRKFRIMPGNEDLKQKRFKGTTKCNFCGDGHYPDQCMKYPTVKDRKARLKDRCYVCLRMGHRSNKCNSRSNCVHCGGRHNRALCYKKLRHNKDVNQQAQKVVDKSAIDASGKGKISESPNAHTIKDTQSFSVSNHLTFLQTAVAKINNIPVRLLLDSGSQRSYLNNRTARKLNLILDKSDLLMIYTFGSETPKEMLSPSVEIEVTTKRGITQTIRVNVVNHITDRLPVAVLGSEGDCENIDFLADDDTIGEAVDLLIGNDYYFSFIREERIKAHDHLYLINSDFGWLISGNITEEKGDNALSVITYCQCYQPEGSYFTEPDLPLRNIDMKFLWSLESIGILDSPKASREEEVVKYFNDTTLYKEGRYEVKWPWVQFPPDLPTNFGLTFGRLKSLLRKIDEDTLTEYNAIFQEQMDAGIIEIVEPKSSSWTQVNPPVHYLPHHMVKQRDKRGRIVYDASAKVKGQKSLNECLYSGPSMLEDLTGLLLKFRTGRIGITADVEKAFLQVSLQDEDRDVTRFLWVKDPTKELTEDNLVHLRFCRVPFGIISSPFLLTATIRHHIARTNKDLLEKIADKCYVDNLVLTVDSKDEALNLYKDTRSVFNEISMNIRDWMSNSKEFLALIPEDQRAKETEQIKILGLKWVLKQDKLTLNFDKISKEVETDSITKRDVLSTISKLYDPCGVVAPAILPAKLIFQELCIRKIKWDAVLPDDLKQKWKTVLDELKMAKNVNLPRYVGHCMPTGKMRYELHCFCDASKDAFAAVVYLRMIVGNVTKTAFLMSKSRVTPHEDKDDLKIPRLELLACLIGNRLIRYVKNNIDVTISRQLLWTDSQIVLAWMKSNKLLPPFVQRRINEIKQNNELESYYVNTKANPADIATRPELWQAKQTLWFHGPEFLVNDEACWPSNVVRDQSVLLLAGEALDGTEVVDGPEMTTKGYETNYEDTRQHLLDTEMESTTLEFALPSEDVEMTENENNEVETLKKLQAKYFPDEISGKETHLSRNLGLFVDVDGLLRSKGRIGNAGCPYDTKHPILIPKDSSFTDKIIQKVHCDNYHIGVPHTLNILRSKYWIPHGRAQVSKVLSKCPKCIKHGGGPYKLPPPAVLPSERVNYSNPFTYVGIDYMGPLYVDTSAGKQKRWICLFTCLAIRAIHLEIVNDLTAEECLLALRRFIATRNLPKKIVSDNALYFKLVSEVLSNPYCQENGIQWKFIPQLAPWHGGVYERLVGLVKNCLKRTLDKHLLNDHQLLTVAKEVEVVINTRPLTSIGTEPEHVLKPSDFLSFNNCLVPVPSDHVTGNETNTKIDLMGSWKRGHAVIGEFQKMFTTHYLTSLRERYRHSYKQPRVKSARLPRIGDIVQLRDAAKNRENWKVGKISSLIKSADGQCRIAKVMVGDTEFTRSIGHLYPLEADVSDGSIEPGNVDSNASTDPIPISQADELPPRAANDPVPIIPGGELPHHVDLEKSDPNSTEGHELMDIAPNESQPVQINVEPAEVQPFSASDISEADDNAEKANNEVPPPPVTEVTEPLTRRDAAVRARQKIAEWTRQLVALL